MPFAVRPDAAASVITDPFFPTIDNVVPLAARRGKPCALPPGFVALEPPEPLSTFYASRRKAEVVPMPLRKQMAWMKLGRVWDGHGETVSWSRVEFRPWPRGIGKTDTAQLLAYAEKNLPTFPRYVFFVQSTKITKITRSV